MAAKRKQKKSVFLRLLVLGVAIYMIVTLSGLWNTLNDNRAKLDDLKSKYKSEKIEVEQLRSLLKDGSQEEIIEKAARERLGYVYSNEEIYIDISGN